MAIPGVMGSGGHASGAAGRLDKQTRARGGHLWGGSALCPEEIQSGGTGALTVGGWGRFVCLLVCIF